MTNLPGDLRHELGNLYGLRTWIEYGFKHVKNELGWADHRLTDYTAIERWWELVFSAYLMVSLQTRASSQPIHARFSMAHPPAAAHGGIMAPGGSARSTTYDCCSNPSVQRACCFPGWRSFPCPVCLVVSSSSSPVSIFIHKDGL